MLTQLLGVLSADAGAYAYIRDRENTFVSLNVTSRA